MFQLLLTIIFALTTPSPLHAQTRPDLVTNGGFEGGAAGWTPVAGGYGRAQTGWAQAGERARIVTKPVHAGRYALSLNAVGLDHEVDAYSQPIPVRPNYGYRLTAFVRQLRGADGYKVTIDWQTAEGKHIRYDNDWRGSDRPEAFKSHGGVFIAPREAGRAALILGVQKGAQCVFDAISLEEMGETEPLTARPRQDGDGRMEITGGEAVLARGFATWRAAYICGESGLPVGGAIVLRRYPVSYDWSPPQGSQPGQAGYVTVSAPRGALFDVQSGPMQAVVLRLQWPALLPGDRVEITVGDRSGGGPGMRVQGKPIREACWFGGSDCNADGEGRDLPETRGGRFAVVPGPAVGARIVTPALAHAGRPAEIRVEAVDAAGNPTGRFQGRYRLSCAPPLPGLPRAVEFRESDEGRKTLSLTWNRPGRYTLAARSDTGGPAPEARAWLIVTPPLVIPAKAGTAPPAEQREEAQAKVGPDWALLANGRIALLLARVGGQWGAGVVMARGREGWRKVAAIPGAGRAVFGSVRSLAPGSMPGELFYADRIEAQCEARSARLILRGNLRADKGTVLPFTLTYRLDETAAQMDARLSVKAVRPVSLVSLHAPILYAGDGMAGERKAGALFPGLEFLTPEEVSSDDSGVAWDKRERWVPHPYKITVPLMCVAAEGNVVGLTWDPLQKWDGVRSVPLAQFASPDRPEGKSDHLLSLLAPGFTPAFVENAPGVAKGWAIPAGREVSLSAGIFVLADTEDMADAVRYWTLTHNLPAPAFIREPRAALALVAKGYMQTAWDAKAKGWITAVGWKPGFQESIADRLLRIAGLCGDPALAARASEQAQEAIRAAGGPQGVSLNLRSGDAEQAVAALREAAYGMMAKQRPEGGWTFADMYSTEGMRASLAQPQDIQLGTCVNALDPILTYAVATGDPKAVAAGLRGLDYIRRFYKPAGAESWEVPLICPNLRAAALAVRCFLRGWQLNGREVYLDQARRWAWAGAAFIYLWQAPDRPVMPGASISVMGTTFYESTWFGWAVQWVGLVYAESLQELARFDHSADWKRFAELITASALRQQKTESAPCGHVGFFPDSYSLLKGADSYEWCLAPTGIADNVIGLMGGAWEPCVLTVGAMSPRMQIPPDRRQVHILSGGLPTRWDWDTAGSRLRLSLKNAPGETGQAVVFGLQNPSRVTWDGQQLAQIPPDAGDRAGWFVPPGERALIFRLRWTREEQELVVEGAQSAGYAPPQEPVRLTNGGFEEGTTGWRCDPGAKVDTANPHGGRNALLIESPDSQHEQQAWGQPFHVEGGRRYRLRAWVRQIEGDGNYKVTLEWLGAGGEHLRYDNDWQGSDRPRDYREHGGVFAAPPNAFRARIIMGCRGARCLFDGITLEPVE
jgi:hypothetical protein